MLDIHVQNEPLELKPSHLNLIRILPFPFQKKDATICVEIIFETFFFLLSTIPIHTTHANL